MAVAEPDPADARRQALELDAPPRHVEPVVQMPVVAASAPSPWRRCGRCLPDRRRARPSGTARCRGRTAAGYRRARSRENRRRRRRPSPSPSGGCCCRSRTVGHAAPPEIQHGAHMDRHRFLRGAFDALRIARAPRLPLGERPARRQIAVERIVRRGLVGDDVGLDAAAHQLRHASRRRCRAAPTESGLRSSAGALDHRQRLVEVIGLRDRDSRS